MKAPPEQFGGRWLQYSPSIKWVFDETAKVRAVVDDFPRTILLLTTDVQHAIDALAKGQNQDFWRRTVIKTVANYFEGQMFAMKRIAVEYDRHFFTGFNTGELAVLREDKYILKENGDVKTSQKGFQPFLSNIRFAFKSFARAHGRVFELDKNGLEDLDEVVEVRNRLTHPKAATDLTVTEAEIKLAEKVTNWLMDQTKQILAICDIATTSLPLRYMEGRQTLELTMPYLLHWHDCNSFEFPSEKAALAFAVSNGATADGKEYLIFGPYFESSGSER